MGCTHWDCPIITQAYKEFCSRPLHQRRVLHLPAGFVLDRAHVASLPALTRKAGSTALRPRSSRSSGQSTGPVRRSDKHEIDSYRPRSRTSARQKSDSSGPLGPRRDDQNRVVKSENSNRSADRGKSNKSNQVRLTGFVAITSIFWVYADCFLVGFANSRGSN